MSILIQGITLDPVNTTIKTFELYQDMVLRKKNVARIRGQLYGILTHSWIEVEMKPGEISVYDISMTDKPIIAPRQDYYRRFGIKHPEKADYCIFRTIYNEQGPDDLNLLRPHVKKGVTFNVVREYQYYIYQGDGSIKIEKHRKIVSLF